MSGKEKLQFCKGDTLAIVAVIVLAIAILLCYFPGKQESSGQAVIYLNGEQIKTVDLTKNQTFTISDRYHNIIEVTDGQIAIVASDCPGQDCVHSGSIGSSGRILVCLPNALEIRILSDETDVDFVVG